jgi:hypothetical protein
MIGFICLAAGTLIRLNDSTIIVQTQGSSTTFFSQMLPVIIGGIIVLISNYALQIHSYRVQNKTNLMNKRIEAYTELLKDISNYRSERRSLGDMEFHVTKAAIYGSSEVSKRLQKWIGARGLYESDEFRKFMEEIKGVIIGEITKENANSNSRWQFWK